MNTVPFKDCNILTKRNCHRKLGCGIQKMHLSKFLFCHKPIFMRVSIAKHYYFVDQHRALKHAVFRHFGTMMN